MTAGGFRSGRGPAEGGEGRSPSTRGGARGGAEARRGPAQQGRGPDGFAGGEGRHALPSRSIRTCVGCGRKAEPAGLVRLRLVEGRVAVDRARSGGRGAWLHPGPACLARALRRRALARAFRGEVAVDGIALGAQLTETGVQD